MRTLLILSVLIFSQAGFSALPDTPFAKCGSTFFPQAGSGPEDYSWVYGTDILTSKDPSTPGKNYIHTSTMTLAISNNTKGCAEDKSQTREDILANWIKDAAKRQLTPQERLDIIFNCRALMATKDVNPSLLDAFSSFNSRYGSSGGGTTAPKTTN